MGLMVSIFSSSKMFPNQDTTFISFKISIAILQVSSIVMEALKLTTEASKNRDPGRNPVTPFCHRSNLREKNVCLISPKWKKINVIIKNLPFLNSSIQKVMEKNFSNHINPNNVSLHSIQDYQLQSSGGYEPASKFPLPRVWTGRSKLKRWISDRSLDSTFLLTKISSWTGPVVDSRWVLITKHPLKKTLFWMIGLEIHL